jgi:polyhydroxybutyrate depolymerase
MSMTRRTFTVLQGNRQRQAVVMLPSAAATRPVPLVLAFHGGLGGPRVFEQQSRLTVEAERRGFAVCYPYGTGYGAALTFNAGICCGYAVRYRIDDVAFVRALLYEIRVEHDISDAYACGFSNGGMLCHRLACKLPEEFAAIAVVSGSLPPMDTPRGPVAMFMIHGRQDRNLPYAGGMGDNAVQPVNHQSFEAGVNAWLDANACSDGPPHVLRTPEYTKRTWNSPFGATVSALLLDEGGHTWPGGLDVGGGFNLGKVITNVPASSLIWEFFARHHKA